MCRMLRTTTDQDRPSFQMGENETQRSVAKNPRMETGKMETVQAVTPRWSVARNHHNVSKLLACAAALTTLTHTHTLSQPPTDTHKHASSHTLIDNHRACPVNIWQQTYSPLKYPYRDTRAVWSNIALRCADGSNCGAQDAGVYKRPMLHHQLRGGGGRGRGGEVVPKGVECLFKNMCFPSC